MAPRSTAKKTGPTRKPAVGKAASSPRAAPKTTAASASKSNKSTAKAPRKTNTRAGRKPTAKKQSALRGSSKSERTIGRQWDVTTLEQLHFLPAAPMDVYSAIVDAKKHTAYTGSKATSVAKVGGSFSSYDGYILGKYIELEPGRRIVQEWTTTEWPPGYPPSRLELTFAKKGSGTLLVMKHTLVPKSQAASYDQGWIDFYWKPMQTWFSQTR